MAPILRDAADPAQSTHRRRNRWLSHCLAYIEYCADPVYRHERPYEIDGVVVKIDACSD